MPPSDSTDSLLELFGYGKQKEPALAIPDLATKYAADQLASDPFNRVAQNLSQAKFQTSNPWSALAMLAGQGIVGGFGQGLANVNTNRNLNDAYDALKEQLATGKLPENPDLLPFGKQLGLIQEAQRSAEAKAETLRNKKLEEQILLAGGADPYSPMGQLATAIARRSQGLTGPGEDPFAKLSPVEQQIREEAQKASMMGGTKEAGVKKTNELLSELSKEKAEDTGIENRAKAIGDIYDKLSLTQQEEAKKGRGNWWEAIQSPWAPETPVLGALSPASHTPFGRALQAAITDITGLAQEAMKGNPANKENEKMWPGLMPTYVDFLPWNKGALEAKKAAAMDLVRLTKKGLPYYQNLQELAALRQKYSNLKLPEVAPDSSPSSDTPPPASAPKKYTASDLLAKGYKLTPQGWVK